MRWNFRIEYRRKFKYFPLNYLVHKPIVFLWWNSVSKLASKLLAAFSSKIFNCISHKTCFNQCLSSMLDLQIGQDLAPREKTLAAKTHFLFKSKHFLLAHTVFSGIKSNPPRLVGLPKLAFWHYEWRDSRVDELTLNKPDRLSKYWLNCRVSWIFKIQL